MTDRIRSLVAQIECLLFGFWFLGLALDTVYWHVFSHSWGPAPKERGILACVLMIFSFLCFWIFAGERKYWHFRRK